MARKLIHKYRHFDAAGFHVRLLSHGELFFASPTSFNDPFDCALPLRLDKASPEEAIPLFAEEAKRQRPSLTDEEALEIAREAVEGDTGYTLQELQALTEIGRKRIGELFRICSMSADPGNLLMWSHYSDNHRGFCVSFDWDKLSASLGSDSRGGFYVSYSPKMPALVPGRMSERDVVWQAITTKYQCWDYEEEYRFYCSADIPAVHVVPEGVIAEVTMGCEISMAHRDLLICALRSRGDFGVSLYQATKQVDQFALTREPVAFEPAT